MATSASFLGRSRALARRPRRENALPRRRSSPRATPSSNSAESTSGSSAASSTLSSSSVRGDSSAWMRPDSSAACKKCMRSMACQSRKTAATARGSWFRRVASVGPRDMAPPSENPFENNRTGRRTQSFWSAGPSWAPIPESESRVLTACVSAAVQDVCRRPETQGRCP